MLILHFIKLLTSAKRSYDNYFWLSTCSLDGEASPPFLLSFIPSSSPVLSLYGHWVMFSNSFSKVLVFSQTFLAWSKVQGILNLLFSYHYYFFFPLLWSVVGVFILLPYSFLVVSSLHPCRFFFFEKKDWPSSVKLHCPLRCWDKL